MSTQNDIFSRFAQHTVWDFMISRGIVCLIIGILFILMPLVTIKMLCILLGVFLLINGIFALIKPPKSNNDKRMLLVYGLFCLILGIIILMNQALSIYIFITIFAFIVLVTGANQLITAIKSKSIHGSARLLAVLSGIMSLLLGLALLIRPDIGLKIIGIIIGIYFVAFGILAIATGSVIRKANKNGQTIVG
jgi:uncharacterized membrane protein HdeD (DUF308 family)